MIYVFPFGSGAQTCKIDSLAYVADFIVYGRVDSIVMWTGLDSPLGRQYQCYITPYCWNNTPAYSARDSEFCVERNSNKLVIQFCINETIDGCIQINDAKDSAAYHIATGEDYIFFLDSGALNFKCLQLLPHVQAIIPVRDSINYEFEYVFDSISNNARYIFSSYLKTTAWVCRGEYQKWESKKKLFRKYYYQTFYTDWNKNIVIAGYSRTDNIFGNTRRTDIVYYYEDGKTIRKTYSCIFKLRKWRETVTYYDKNGKCIDSKTETVKFNKAVRKESRKRIRQQKYWLKHPQPYE